MNCYDQCLGNFKKIALQAICLQQSLCVIDTVEILKLKTSVNGDSLVDYLSLVHQNYPKANYPQLWQDVHSLVGNIQTHLDAFKAPEENATGNIQESILKRKELEVFLNSLRLLIRVVCDGYKSTVSVFLNRFETDLLAIIECIDKLKDSLEKRNDISFIWRCHQLFSGLINCQITCNFLISQISSADVSLNDENIPFLQVVKKVRNSLWNDQSDGWIVIVQRVLLHKSTQENEDTNALERCIWDIHETISVCQIALSTEQAELVSFNIYDELFHLIDVHISDCPSSSIVLRPYKYLPSLPAPFNSLFSDFTVQELISWLSSHSLLHLTPSTALLGQYLDIALDMIEQAQYCLFFSDFKSISISDCCMELCNSIIQLHETSMREILSDISDLENSLSKQFVELAVTLSKDGSIESFSCLQDQKSVQNLIHVIDTYFKNIIYSKNVYDMELQNDSPSILEKIYIVERDLMQVFEHTSSTTHLNEQPTKNSSGELKKHSIDQSVKELKDIGEEIVNQKEQLISKKGKIYFEKISELMEMKKQTKDAASLLSFLEAVKSFLYDIVANIYSGISESDILGEIQSTMENMKQDTISSK